jgi:hypothetical protein
VPEDRSNEQFLLPCSVFLLTNCPGLFFGCYILKDICHSISDNERLVAVTAASTCFDHELPSVHDEEIDAGADSALCKHLALLLMKHNFVQDPGRGASRMDLKLWKEISVTCSTIEMIYRCELLKLGESFHRVGGELLPLLLTVMAHVLQKRQEDGNAERGSSPGSQMEDEHPWTSSILSATKIVAHYATVTTALVPIAQQRGLLSTLKRVATASSILPEKARFSSLWTLANLACDAENMVLMAVHPGLVDALVRVSYDDPSFESRTHAAKAIANLAWRPENKIPMSERPILLDAMTKLMGSSVTKTRRHASKAFRFLSDTPDSNKVRLCQHGGNSILATVLKRANNDADRAVRECAATTLCNLVCRETAVIMGDHPGLLDTLANIAVMTERGNAPTLAGEALCELSDVITPDMRCFGAFNRAVESVVSFDSDSSNGNGSSLGQTNFSVRRETMLARLSECHKANLMQEV